MYSSFSSTESSSNPEGGTVGWVMPKYTAGLS